MRTAILAATIILMAGGATYAGDSTDGKSCMWGTCGDDDSALNSAAMHVHNGTAAAQVLTGRNATSNNVSNTAIGVQNNNSVIGNGSINSEQTGTNTGGISAEQGIGSINH